MRLLTLSLCLFGLSCSTTAPENRRSAVSICFDSCEEAQAECGAVSDGCDGVLECGECELGLFCGGGGPNRCGKKACEKRACLPDECGIIDDNCDGVLDSGGCNGDASCLENVCECVADKYEPNKLAKTPADIAAYEDDAGFGDWFQGLTLQRDEEDWFSADISDERNGGNPNFRVSVHSLDQTAKFDVAVHFVCNLGRGAHVCFGGDSSPDDSTCDAILGPEGTSWVGMEVSCQGIRDSGKALIRVRRVCEGEDCFGLCTAYSLGLSVF